MTIERNFRINEQIRISPLRVVGAEGSQLGIIAREEALSLSREAGLDLVEVAPMERPPVCRIMDYGKFKYEQKKKAHKQKQHHTQLKEIRVRPKTGEHDVDVKIKHARDFLEDQDKVLVSVFFRGREITHIEQGRAVMQQVVAALEDVAKLEKAPSMEGKRLTAVFAPR